MVNWEFFDNQTPQSAKQLVDDLRAGDDVRADPGPDRLCTWKQATRILAGFGDGQAAEGPSAGPASLVGLEARQGARLDGAGRQAARRRYQVTDTLTPVLTAHWDQPDSFTLAGYSRTGGYKALPQGAGDAAGRRDRHGEELRAARPWRRRASRPA